VVNYEQYSLLGCNAVQFTEGPTFWRNILPQYQCQKVSQARIQQKQVASCLAYSLTDGGNMFFQNTVLSELQEITTPKITLFLFNISFIPPYTEGKNT
jgi:hypothetical protein